MYLKGSKWSYNTKPKRPANPLRILVLVGLVGVALYVNQVIVPTVDPLFVPTPTPTRSPESYVTEAQSLVGQGKLTQAESAYELAIQADPKNASNYVELSRLQVFSGKYTEAIENTENALLLNQNNALAHAVRGWAISFTGDYLSAEAEFKNALELDPNLGIVYAYYTEMLMNQNSAGSGDLGTLDKAISMSKEAQRLAPDLLETHRARGIVLEQTQNFEEALKEYEAAVALNDNIADLHMALGRVYRSLQQLDKATEQFLRANALNPADPLPETYISRTYAQAGEYARAIQYAEQAVKDDPADAFLYGNLGTMQFRNRQYEDAIPNLRLAVRGGTSADGQTVEGLPLDYGRVAEYYTSYGLSLARTGECGEALQISQLVAQGVKDDETAVYNAGEVVNVCQSLANGDATPEAGAATDEAGDAGEPTSADPTAEAPAPEATPEP